jgi:hypothetical protein
MLQPFNQIFPDAEYPVTSLTLERKVGKTAKGVYSFVELYCIDKGCDCKRVMIFVLSEKQKVKAVISFGFDPDGPLAGPYLDEYHEQSAAAKDMLELFTFRINQDTEWLEGMYDRYRQVRSHVDRKKYQVKDFPLPGSVERRATEPPDLKKEIVTPFAEELEKQIRRGGRIQQSQAGNLHETGTQLPLEKEEGLLNLIERISKVISAGNAPISHDLENEFRVMVLARQEVGIELAALLPTLIPHTAKEEARMNVALSLLSCLLEELRTDIERGRKGATERMLNLQEALARHVFNEGGDPNLCAAVGRTLLESRVEILPVIQDANRRRMISFPGVKENAAPIDIDTFLGEGLREMGCTDPYMALDLILEQTGLLEPEFQIAMFGEMLASSIDRLRDIAALMLFHPLRDVRIAVAGMLAQVSGETISPETLRRFIIIRNWFPAEIRKELDTAISNARRAKVECAPLRGNTLYSISATTIDGAGAQSFWIAAGEKKRFDLCNILWKQGVGVIDTFIHRLPSAKGVDRFLEGLPDIMCFANVEPDYIDKVLGHALAVGTAQGGAPHRGLLQIAEILGTDRWKANPFDPLRELDELREELERHNPELLTAGAVAGALDESADWPAWQEFADAWFEDDDLVDRVVQNAVKGKGGHKELKAVEDILSEVLETRRTLWLERLVLMTLWLKSSRPSPIPWDRMFHVADAVAAGSPLKDIPLMFSIAEVSYEVAMERSEDLTC